METRQPRLLLVGGEKLFLDCLATVLEERGVFSIVGVSLDVLGAPEDGEDGTPEIVLLDLGPTSEGHLSIGECRTLFPEANIMAIADEGCVDDPVEVFTAGADGYLPKDVSLADLVHAMELVATGERVCDPRFAGMLFKRLSEADHSHRSISRPRTLSDRERQIVAHIGSGATNQQIADELCISLYTVKNHVHNILEKLNVRNRLEAVNRANKAGLLAH